MLYLQDDNPTHNIQVLTPCKIDIIYMYTPCKIHIIYMFIENDKVKVLRTYLLI